MFNIPPFLTLRQPDLPSTATPPPARASTMESLGFVLVFFGKDWCGYVNVPKKDCLISIAHHSFSLGSLIFPPLQHRPLQERAMWRFLDLLVAFFLRKHDVGMSVYQKKMQNFYSPSFLLLRQPDLSSTATPTPARDSTVEILGFVFGIFFGKHDVGMSVFQKKKSNFYSPSFLPLRQPDLASDAAATQSWI